MKTIHLIQVGVGALLLLLSSCGDEEAKKEAKMAKGFVLPKGDAEKGKLAFIEMQCHRCHSVAGETFPENTEASKVRLHLGGEVHKVKTYGQLVTSVIHPDHVVSKDYLETLEKEKREGAESPMPSFNGEMTVEEMINIVEFLNSHYMKLEPDYEVPHYYP